MFNHWFPLCSRKWIYLKKEIHNWNDSNWTQQKLNKKFNMILNQCITRVRKYILFLLNDSSFVFILFFLKISSFTAIRFVKHAWRRNTKFENKKIKIRKLKWDQMDPIIEMMDSCLMVKVIEIKKNSFSFYFLFSFTHLSYIHSLHWILFVIPFSKITKASTELKSQITIKLNLMGQSHRSLTFIILLHSCCKSSYSYNYSLKNHSLSWYDLIGLILWSVNESV